MNLVDRIMRLIFTSDFTLARVTKKRKMLAEILDGFIKNQPKRSK